MEHSDHGDVIRTFTPTGAVNSTAKRDKSDKTLVQQEQNDWDPQSMMILDLLDAIRWAGILIQISTQETIDAYIERCVQLTRKNPQRLHNVKEAWDTFSWTIAMLMRNNISFKQATEEILQDPVTIADILTYPRPASNTKPSTRFFGNCQQSWSFRVSKITGK